MSGIIKQLRYDSLTKKGICIMKKVSKRILSVRRHTLGYVVGGKRQTVREATQMAKRGEIMNVHVVGNHVQSIPGHERLTDLPYSIVK